LTDDEYKKEMDAASVCKAKNRDLMLVYNHDDKEIYLIDEAHGGGNMVGFGMLLDSRITNPLAEEWAAFWLDGKTEWPCPSSWAGSGRGGGGMDWIKTNQYRFCSSAGGRRLYQIGVWGEEVRGAIRAVGKGQ
jgi:hypothetical protein